MITKLFEITREYPIPCKLFLPAQGCVRRVILGVHGFAGDKESSMLLELAKGIEASGGALVCFDFPAHGESRAEEEQLTVENCMKDLLAVAGWIGDTYPPADKYLFATSFGGYIALLASDRLAGYRMILRAPAVTMPQVLLRSVLKITPEEFERRKCVPCGFERKMQLPYSFYRDLLRYDPFCKEYDRDILVIQGNRDDVVPPEDVKAFVQNREHVRLFLLENADHRFKNEGEIGQIVQETVKFMDQTQA